MVGAALCAAALPLAQDAATRTFGWVLGGSAALLTVVAAVLLLVARRRDDATLRGVVAQRDSLAASLDEAVAALEGATTALRREEESRDEQRKAVEIAVVALSRKVQASAHRIQEEAARMVQRHSADPDVLQTSMRIDHAAAQHARQAQNLVALCGRRPGQSWDAPLPLPDVVKAAAGRITAFQRVDVSGEPGLAVVGQAVEPVVHVVAELLANATQCSPPSTQVLVVIRQVQRGAVVEIDDCGVGMGSRELDRARQVASGKEQVGIADLGEVPQTGLAVVGAYARQLGLRVDLVESVYGGLRAVVMVPSEITVPASAATDALAPAVDEAWRASAPSGAVPPARPVGAHSAPTAVVDAPAVAPSPGERAAEAPPVPAERPVLPQRRSRRAETGSIDAGEVGAGRARRGGPGAPEGASPAARRDRGPAVRAADQTAEQAGAWIGAFFAAAGESVPAAPSAPDDHEAHEAQSPREKSGGTDLNTEDR
ncbi:ATP-binding protein [Isoptericola sp. BMS4]|uniref:ATP-binding protein n=1 Tax=Isoptericola sp. BMS4 TaxID=2527875 RepID=UPI00141F69A9|nr:ATP-binding protein [Isoptericola sp. BMS4]